ncbi:MAG: hypothetical protein KTR14_07725 [Vampirovibrio sp.]|nr:hypothetical protein [Vampirovibrio sp.]
MFKQLMKAALVAAVIALSVPMVGQAEEVDPWRIVFSDGKGLTRQSFENKDFKLLVPAAGNLEKEIAIPLIEQPTNEPFAILLENQTNKGYYMEVPNASETVYVAPFSDRRTPLNISSFPLNQTVPFYINNEGGERIATGSIVNGEIITPVYTSASQEQYAEWNRRLEQLIVSNRYVAPQLPQKPEPVYHRSASTKQAPVRGYW